MAIISLIFPLYAYAQGQTAPLPTPTSQPQCVDFNSDKVCESIVLANGTMIPNPALEARPTSPTSSGQATNFATYQSPAMGIGIQYPLSWQLEEGNGKVVFVQQKDVVSLETGVDGDIGSSLSEYANTRHSCRQLNLLLLPQPVYGITDTNSKSAVVVLFE